MSIFVKSIYLFMAVAFLAQASYAVRRVQPREQTPAEKEFKADQQTLFKKYGIVMDKVNQADNPQHGAIHILLPFVDHKGFVAANQDASIRAEEIFIDEGDTNDQEVSLSYQLGDKTYRVDIISDHSQKIGEMTVKEDGQVLQTFESQQVVTNGYIASWVRRVNKEVAEAPVPQIEKIEMREGELVAILLDGQTMFLGQFPLHDGRDVWVEAAKVSGSIIELTVGDMRCGFDRHVDDFFYIDVRNALSSGDLRAAVDARFSTGYKADRHFNNLADYSEEAMACEKSLAVQKEALHSTMFPDIDEQIFSDGGALSVLADYIHRESLILNLGLSATQCIEDDNGDGLSNDIINLYKALAVVKTDGRCGIQKFKGVEEIARSRGVKVEPACVLKMKSSQFTSVSVSEVTVLMQNGSEKIVRVDAEHFTDVSVADLLFGRQNNQGLYKQLDCGVSRQPQSERHPEMGSTKDLSSEVSRLLIKNDILSLSCQDLSGYDGYPEVEGYICEKNGGETLDAVMSKALFESLKAEGLMMRGCCGAPNSVEIKSLRCSDGQCSAQYEDTTATIGG